MQSPPFICASLIIISAVLQQKPQVISLKAIAQVSELSYNGGFLLPKIECFHSRDGISTGQLARPSSCLRVDSFEKFARTENI